MSEHAEKNHPIAGYVAALIIGALIIWLVSVMNSMPYSLLMVPFVLGWSVFSLWLYSRKGADEH